MKIERTVAKAQGSQDVYDDVEDGSSSEAEGKLAQSTQRTPS
jgi:hypothetical protein